MATLSITVPDALVPRVMTALRDQYPDLTAGLADGPAAKAVLKQIVRTIVVASEKRTAQKTLDDSVSTAGQQAWTDTDAIT